MEQHFLLREGGREDGQCVLYAKLLEEFRHWLASDGQSGTGWRLEELFVFGADTKVDLRSSRRRYEHAAKQIADQRFEWKAHIFNVYCVDYP